MGVVSNKVTVVSHFSVVIEGVVEVSEGTHDDQHHKVESLKLSEDIDYQGDKMSSRRE
jgi:hypothetical protein